MKTPLITRIFKYNIIILGIVFGNSYNLFCQTTVICPVSADAFIPQKNPSTNYGSNTSILIGREASGEPIETLLKFDLSLVTVCATITSAELILDYNGPHDQVSADIYYTTSSWNESTVNWNSRPSYGNWYAWFNAPSGTGSGSYQIPLTDPVKEWIENGVSNYGIFIKTDISNTTSGSLCFFHSKEGSGEPPKLMVTYSSGTNSTSPSSVSASINPLCSGGATTLNVSDGSLGTGASWRWYSGSCGGTFLGSGSSIAVSPTTTTSYYVRAEGDCNTTSCASKTITAGTSSSVPTSAFASQNIICSGSSTTLSVSGGSLGTGASWKWYSSGCGSGLVGTGTSISVTPTTTTTYYVRAEGDCNTTSCTSVTVDVQSNSTQPTSIIANPSAICPGNSTTLNVSGGALGTGASWEWYSETCGGTSLGSGNSISVTPTSTTTYYVRAEGDCNTTSCVSATVEVKAESEPPVTATAGSESICPGNSTTLNITGGPLGTGASWKWYSASCGNGLVGSGSSITVSPTSTTTYYVRAEGDCNTTSCSNVTVSISDISTIPTSASASSTSICSGTSTTLNVSGGALGTGASWEWYSAGCGNTYEGSGSTLSVSPVSTTTYYVRAEGDCNETTCQSVLVTVDPKPTPDFTTSSTTLNVNDCISFTDQSIDNPTGWSWSFEGASPNSSISANPTGICYDSYGKFDVSLTASNACGANTEMKSEYITVLNNATDFTSFSFSISNTGPPGIDLQNHTVDIKVPNGTSLASLRAIYDLSYGAHAEIGGINQNSGSTINDFTNPVTYTIIAEDGISTQNWTIHVSLNSLPTDISLSANSIAENEPISTLIGTFTTSDTDTEDTFIQSLIPGIGDTDNTSFLIVDDQLLTNEEFNFEVKNSYNIRVRTDDGYGGIYEEPFEITISDANDSPADIVLDNNNLDENLQLGTLIGNLTSTDEDANDSHTYSLVPGDGDTDNNSFDISGDQLISNQVFDYETKDSYGIRVQTEDETGESISEPFTIIINDVNEPPEITLSTLPDEFAYGNSSVKASISVSDDSPSIRVEFYRKNIMEQAYGNPTIVNKTGGNYEIDIKKDWLGFEGMEGLEYYFRVSDGEFTVSTQTVHMVVVYSADNAQFIPKLSFGGQPENWRMFSIPYELTNNSIESIFESVLGPYDNSKWRIVRYDNSKKGFIEHKTDFNTIEQSKGYWFNSIEEVDIPMGPGKSPRVNSENRASIQLDRGWTQIGNPYTFDILWQSVLDSNNVSDGSVKGLKIFEGGTELKDAAALKAFSGAYVESTQQITLEIPLIDEASSTSRIKEEKEQPGWILKINLKAGKYETTISGLGMHPEANESIDPFDGIRVPRFVKYVDITFKHPEYFSPNFAMDIVPEKENYTWEFSVESNVDTDFITVSWSEVSNDAEVFVLLDREDDAIIDLRSTYSYTYPKKDSKKFKIIYGSEEFLTGELNDSKIFLGNNYPNPFSNNTIIPFSLFGDTQFDVELSVFDLNGVLVDVIINSKFSSGFHEVEWDLSTSGHRLSKGLYIYSLKAKSENQNKVLYKRMLIE